MRLTPEQESAVRAPGSVAVTAGAGTGKTHMLTERYLHHLLQDGLRPLEIVAATFTEAAAAELRSRIRERLRGVPELESHAAELEAAQIGTLHSLAGRICREHPDAAGVPYDFRVQDELEQRLWRARHLREALADLPERLGRNLPFDVLSEALASLLDDPHTAERALAVDPDAWPAMIAAEKARTFSRIAARPEWQHAVAVLAAHRGPPDDKMELQRTAALEAVAALERGEFGSAASRVLDSLSRRPGGRKIWGDAVDELKEACGTLRDLYREGSRILELEPGPADDALREALPDLREAYRMVAERLAAAKRSERVLDFGDLEVHALRALGHADVRDFYARRWKAFLVDEFQDTNAVQAELLERLGAPGPVRLTVVGDEKQSIYGFRRADVGVFRDVRARIRSGGGAALELSTSFRTHHHLLEPLDRLVEPALGGLHQRLRAARQDPPADPPFISLHLVSDGPGIKQFRQRAEAHLLGETIEELLAGVTVHDRYGGELRPAAPGDIAVLARTWNSLGAYGDELAARGIPAIHAGGGSLLDQREARDGAALLGFLAHPEDDLELATILRGPFFAVDDRTLLELAEEASEGGSWWDSLRSRAGPVPPRFAPGSLEYAASVLQELLRRAPEMPPSRLLALADDLTGYTAVLANMPGGPRRLADWRGFCDFVASLERGHADTFAVVRELRAVRGLEDARVPRPGIDAGDAVTLTSVHNAKGLEWPIVILPDITASGGGPAGKVLFEADAGVAVRLTDEVGEELEPGLWIVLDERRRQREREEEVRILYVALTRARDRLILTGSSDRGGRLDALAAGLVAAGIEPRFVPYDPEAAVPKTPRARPAQASGSHLLGEIGPGLVRLPADSLASFASCPAMFRFEHVLEHPGAIGPDGSPRRAAGRRVERLVRFAVERNLADASALSRFDPSLDADRVEEALRLALSFRESEAFAMRGRIEGYGRSFALEVGDVVLEGRAHAVGDDFVLSWVAGNGPRDARELELAVQARALGRDRACIVYLHSGETRTIGRSELDEAFRRVEELVAAVGAGGFEAAPAAARCAGCAYEPLCESSALLG